MARALRAIAALSTRPQVYAGDTVRQRWNHPTLARSSVLLPLRSQVNEHRLGELRRRTSKSKQRGAQGADVHPVDFGCDFGGDFVNVGRSRLVVLSWRDPTAPGHVDDRIGIFGLRPTSSGRDVGVGYAQLALSFSAWSTLIPNVSASIASLVGHENRIAA